MASFNYCPKDISAADLHHDYINFQREASLQGFPSTSGSFIPKIKIKDLKELQYPAIANKTEEKYNTNNNVCFTVQNLIDNEINRTQLPNKRSYFNLEVLLKEKSLKKRLTTIKEQQAGFKERSQALKPKGNQSMSSASRQLTLEIERKLKKLMEFKELQHHKQAHYNDFQLSNQSLSGTSNVICHNNVHTINVQNPNRDRANNFEFINVSENLYEKSKCDLDMKANSVSTGFLNTTHINVQNITNCNSGTENGSENKMSEAFDSTVLRDGVIKASRTLISTEKALKTLSHQIPRSELLSPKQALYLLNKFHSLLRTFNSSFNEIKNAVKKEYDVMLSSDNKQIENPKDECIHGMCNQSKTITVEGKIEYENQYLMSKPQNSIFQENPYFEERSNDVNKRLKLDDNLGRTYESGVCQSCDMTVISGQVLGRACQKKDILS